MKGQQIPGVKELLAPAVQFETMSYDLLVRRPAEMVGLKPPKEPIIPGPATLLSRLAQGKLPPFPAPGKEEKEEGEGGVKTEEIEKEGEKIEQRVIRA